MGLALLSPSLEVDDGRERDAVGVKGRDGTEGVPREVMAVLFRVF